MPQFSLEKYSLFGIMYNSTDYEEATSLIIQNALWRNSFGVSALAVHGLVESCRDKCLRDRVNDIHLVVPDGQPIRWALNSFYGLKLTDRVYGPTLTLKVLEKADENNLSVFLYGSNQNTLDRLTRFIKEQYPKVKIVGVHPDRFRDSSWEEDLADVKRINESGAHIVLVGRGCPRQERWVADHLGKINAVMMAVGAAFDFHAGTKRQAPKWMQNTGLEWLFRLLQEPRRLWKRYLFTNSYFIYLFLKHKFFIRRSN